MILPILTTKLASPPLRQPQVARPQLVGQLRHGVAGPLTLVSAPAGFGKTTLLGAALHAMAGPVAWLSLDPADNDPSRFLHYLVAALQSVVPSVGASFRAALPSGAFQGGVPAMEALLTVLINDLASLTTDLVLVLDDYHVLDTPVIHAGMAFLLDHLPPHLHLVIATREDPPLPLARLRARGHLAELRGTDLRLTSEEAAVFLETVMGLQLEPNAHAALLARTEGWCAGLQLAALALRDAPHPAQVITTLSGTQRYILDYLTDEVLSNQPDEVQDFLLHTAILDQLCGPLCDTLLSAAPPSAVTRGTSQAMLARLDVANLFIVPLDQERRWYRYHALFADLLRSRLTATFPDRVPALHRQAAQWYLDQVPAEGSGAIIEAVRHALTAQDHAQVATVIEQYGASLIGQGYQAPLLAWFTQLPDHLVRTRPRLSITHAWLLNLAGQHQAAEERLMDAEAALATLLATNGAAPELVADVQGNAATIRAYLARHRGAVGDAIRQAQAALSWLPETNAATRTATHLILGVSLLQADDLPAARQHLATATRLGETSGNRHAALAALGMLGEVMMSEGQLHQAARHYHEAITDHLGPHGQPLPIAGDLYLGLGRLLHEWNHLPEAAAQLTQALTLGEQVANWWTIEGSTVALAWTRQMQGERTVARDLVRRAEQLALRYEQVVEVSPLLALQARLDLVQGNLAAVAHWVQHSGLRPTDTPTAAREPLYLMLARAVVALGRVDEALPLLDRLVVAARAAGRVCSEIAILVLHARAWHARADLVAARASLEQAVAVAEGEGYVRAFVDEGPPMAALLRATVAQGWRSGYINHLIAAMPTPSTLPAPDAAHHHAPPPSRDATREAASPLLEPLSAREITFLALLADGLSNREIADQLVITVGTVKWYLNHLYAKLQVRGRTQAIARARALGLI